MTQWTPVLLANVSRPNSEKISTYLAGGGYQALRQALQMSPDEITTEVKNSGLRGRGGAGFPTGTKWSFVPKDAPVKYLAVNTDEGEPGTFKDRLIVERDPHSILEGVIIAAATIPQVPSSPEVTSISTRGAILMLVAPFALLMRVLAIAASLG